LLLSLGSIVSAMCSSLSPPRRGTVA
jgi:hypothetical protein